MHIYPAGSTPFSVFAWCVMQRKQQNEKLLDGKNTAAFCLLSSNLFRNQLFPQNKSPLNCGLNAVVAWVLVNTVLHIPRRARSPAAKLQLLSISTRILVASFSASKSSFRFPPTHLFQERSNISSSGRWRAASAEKINIGNFCLLEEDIRVLIDTPCLVTCK